MGITKKELLANCSPDTLALSAAALAELDGERTITAADYDMDGAE